VIAQTLVFGSENVRPLPALNIAPLFTRDDGSESVRLKADSCIGGGIGDIHQA
jgi:hypothetical protein